MASAALLWGVCVKLILKNIFSRRSHVNWRFAYRRVLCWMAVTHSSALISPRKSAWISAYANRLRCRHPARSALRTSSTTPWSNIRRTRPSIRPYSSSRSRLQHHPRCRHVAAAPAPVRPQRGKRRPREQGHLDRPHQPPPGFACRSASFPAGPELRIAFLQLRQCQRFQFLPQFGSASGSSESPCVSARTYNPVPPTTSARFPRSLESPSPAPAPCPGTAPRRNFCPSGISPIK